MLRIALLSPPRFAWISALIHSPTPRAIVTPTLASARYPTPTVGIVVGIVVFAGVLAFATDGCLPAQGLALAAAKQRPMATEALPKLDLSVVTTGGDHHEGGTESVVYIFAWCIRTRGVYAFRARHVTRGAGITVPSGSPYTPRWRSQGAPALLEIRVLGVGLCLCRCLSLSSCLCVSLSHCRTVSVSLCLSAVVESLPRGEKRNKTKREIRLGSTRK